MLIKTVSFYKSNDERFSIFQYGYDMYDNYLQTQQNVEKELMLTNLANRGTASVKFQDDEEEFQVIILFLFRKYERKHSKVLLQFCIQDCLGEVLL